MAVTAKKYTNADKIAYNAGINLTSDDIRLILVTSSYTPNQDTDIYKDVAPNLAANELPTSGGYTAGGVALSTKTFTTTSGLFTFGAANVSWTNTGGFTAAYAVIFDNTPASNKPLLGYISFGGTVTVASINWTGGIVLQTQN